MADDERQDKPQEPEAQEPEAASEEQQPTPPEEDAPQQGADPAGEASPAEQEAAEAPAEEPPAAEEAAAEEPAAEEAPAEDAPAAETPAADASGDAAPAEDASAAEPERPRRRDRKQGDKKDDEVIPGAHLEPDLVLEEEQRPEDEYADVYADDEEGAAAAESEEGAEAQPVAHEPMDLAADARYHATGKRKTAVARVILRPGEGTYTINGRHLDQFFPRVKLQRMAQQPLETAGYHNRLDVVAKIHGGGVSAQAGALRHGIARALVEADPHLRAELKRRGFLTRDPRVKERKKAGLKKARKRPQFSKR
jgi:small subunit ribosomal protein S9